MPLLLSVWFYESCAYDGQRIVIVIEIRGKLFSCAQSLCAHERDQQACLTRLGNLHRVTTINEADGSCKTLSADMPFDEGGAYCQQPCFYHHRVSKHLIIQRSADMTKRPALRDAENNVEYRHTVHLQEREGIEHKAPQTISSTDEEFNLCRYTKDHLLVFRTKRKEERILVVNLRVIAAAFGTDESDIDNSSSTTRYFLPV